MRILITGGAGCLGSNLVEHWLPRGHEIFVVDTFTTGKRDVLPAVPRLQVVEGSVTDAVQIERCFTEFAPSHVVHAAASYKDPADWLGDCATNIAGAIIVGEAARRHRVSRLINFQTALCYGRPRQVPIPIDHPLQPFTSYGISKVAGEQYMALAGVPMVSLRIANVTGPRLAIGPIPTFYKRLKAGQKCFASATVRDFLDMRDFLALMDRVLDEGAATGIFNVGTGEGHSIKEVFDEVRDFLGVRPTEDVPVVPVSADDVPSVVLDPSATARAFDWQARVGFGDTIRAQLQWYEKHGVSDVYSHLAAPPTR